MQAEAVAARGGVECVIDLTQKIGMVINPDGLISSVTARGQADRIGIRAGCRIFEANGQEVSSLAEFKLVVDELKGRGMRSCKIKYRDFKILAATAANAAKQRAAAAANAAKQSASVAMQKVLLR